MPLPRTIEDSRRTFIMMETECLEGYVDGGIRSGVDVANAIALGADAALVGRAPLWGLGVGGDVGFPLGLGDQDLQEHRTR